MEPSQSNPCGFASSPEGGAFTKKGNLPAPPKSSPFGRAGTASAVTERVPRKMQFRYPIQFTATAPPVKMQFRNARRRF